MESCLFGSSEPPLPTGTEGFVLACREAALHLFSNFVIENKILLPTCLRAPLYLTVSRQE